ncbi:hypothetical protein FGO68_gene13938 [Halteria grandinella]|uniref:Intimal thickness related receptor IRP domain-containing protein n=1 Tax=Halteria grandinella TaxID=5974 RepID=A0A8J8NLP3_HALGN|nr:hypothetical protein FGO68_gene13938 [Halteria grandinella]
MGLRYLHFPLAFIIYFLIKMRTALNEDDDDNDSATITFLDEISQEAEVIEDNARISKHVEIVHFQIEVENKHIIDMLTQKAMENGGSLHQDGKGRQYLFYPVLTKGKNEIAGLCLIHDKDCDLKGRIAYFHGEEELAMYGKIYYREQSFNNPSFQDQRLNLRNFLIMHNSNQFPKNQQNKPQYYQNTKVPIFYTYSDADIEDAIAQISQILFMHKKYISDQNTTHVLLLLLYFLQIGAFSFALRQFWEQMEQDQWAHGLFMQIVYYILYMLGISFIQGLIGTVIWYINVCSKSNFSVFLIILAFLVAPLSELSYCAEKIKDFSEFYRYHLLGIVIWSCVLPIAIYCIQSNRKVTQFNQNIKNNRLKFKLNQEAKKNSKR